ncbi:[Skp1-protein]-hydroxyproline N-acetylglucosaminyltransferase [Diplonema papillatum]|nr:[Skp1-protein]-hydroxyproline N-acetylglucosaminyltransferase [Diplonema papillatum]
MHARRLALIAVPSLLLLLLLWTTPHGGSHAAAVSAAWDGAERRRAAEPGPGRGVREPAAPLKNAPAAAAADGGEEKGEEEEDKDPLLSRAAVRRRDQRTIFVSIAAFRDSEAADTLRSMYETARRPERIFAGVVCQRAESMPEERCIPPEWEGPLDACRLNASTARSIDPAADPAFCPRGNVRLTDMPAAQARGPCHARYLATLLHAGEDFFMMIDSHNKFVDSWDEVALQQHELCDSEKCVLSVYPMALSAAKAVPPPAEQDKVAHLCMTGHWNYDGFPGPFAAGVVQSSKAPRPQPFLGAGFVFANSSMIKDVPFDPHLPFLFQGEEILLTVRLWTHGYDFFSPGRNILYHHYYRNGKPRMEGIPGYRSKRAKSQMRVQYLLRIPRRGASGALRIPLDTDDVNVTIDADKYGVGSVRPMKAYWDYARIDLGKMEGHRADRYWCRAYGGRGPYSSEWKEALRNLVAGD